MRRNHKIVVALIITVVLVTVGLFIWSRNSPMGQSSESEPVYNESSETSTTGPSKAVEPGDHPQAPEISDPSLQPRTETSRSVEPAATPSVDTNKPSSVAEGFMIAYNSQQSGDDDTWEEKTKKWAQPELIEALSRKKDGPLSELSPTAATSVEVKGNVSEWGRDTPLRWAHHLTVTVDTSTDGTYLIDYRVRAYKTDSGWVVNSASVESWTKKV